MPFRYSNGQIRRSQFGIERAREGSLATIRERDLAQDLGRKGVDKEDDDDDGDDAVSTSSSPPPTSAATTAPASASTSKSKDGDDDEAGDVTWALHSSTPTSSPSAFPSSSATAVVTDAAHTPGQVWIMPGTPPPSDGALSPATEHLLIAAGSIGATLIVVLVIVGMYIMRKKGLVLADLIYKPKKGRARPDRTYDIAKPTVHRMPAFAYDHKEAWKGSDAPLPRRPDASASRSDSSLSRPSVPTHSQHLRRPSTPRTSTRSFLEDTTPPRRAAMHSRTASSAQSSPVLLPLQTQRSRGNSQASEYSPPTLILQRQTSLKSSQSTRLTSLRFSAADDMAALDPPAPSFQQFLANRPLITTKQQQQQPGYQSHFSWTQSSQAPPTPIDPLFTGSGVPAGRESVATTASSVARYRTVDSWVGQQTSRIQSTQMHEQPHFSFRASSVSQLGQVDEGHAGWQQLDGADANANAIPGVPEVPSKYQTGHVRQNTGYSEATVFRQHPGTEIKIPRGSLVPSEILDARMVPSAL